MRKVCFPEGMVVWPSFQTLLARATPPMFRACREARSRLEVAYCFPPIRQVMLVSQLGQYLFQRSV